MKEHKVAIIFLLFGGNFAEFRFIFGGVGELCPTVPPCSLRQNIFAIDERVLTEPFASLETVGLVLIKVRYLHERAIRPLKQSTSTSFRLEKTYLMC